MKNFKAYVRTTLAASLVLTTGLLTTSNQNHYRRSGKG